MSYTRRSAVQLLGTAAIPTLARAAGAPAANWGAAAHASAAARAPTLFRTDERAVVSAIADAILPRTDTPGALDVGVPAFIEFITAEWMTQDERDEFRAGIADLDAHAMAQHGRTWPALDARAAASELDWAEQDEAQRTFRRLKSYVLHGYFTSERVQREVLHTNITPGRYFGCNPLPSLDGADA